MSEQKCTVEDIVMLFPFLSREYNEADLVYNIRNNVIDYSDCRIKTPKIIRELIKKFPAHIQHIENPSYQLQKLAVETDGDCIQYVKQTATLCKLAVKSKPSSIFYIKNQTPELCEQVIEYNPHLIKFIKDPSFELVLRALHLSRGCIDKINLLNFTREQLEELKLLII